MASSRVQAGFRNGWTVAVVGLALALVAPTAAPAQAGRGTTGPLTPIVVAEVPQRAIAPVRGTDGRYHVLYELQLTNTLEGPADLRSVRVIDPDSHRRLLSLDAGRIVRGAYLHTLNRTTAETTAFAGNESRVLILNLGFESRSRIPRRLVHRFAVAGAEPFDQQASRFRYLAGRVEVSRRRPPEVRPPLEGPGWLASDGCCGPTGHINALVGLDGQIQGAERFAIDWIQIDASGRIFRGEKTDPASWVGYGKPVNAIAGGVVTTAVDDQQDQTPGTMPSTLAFAQLPGNYVAVRMRGGFTAAYAHLAPGSVRVRVGDRVRAGERLGRLRNSGASLAPHLHFHVVNGPSIFASDGYPFTFDAFRLAAAKTETSNLLRALNGEAGYPPRSDL
jgi:hypothetical protein